MQCRSCGTPLPTGAANCPGCGAATSPSSGGYDPTFMTPSPHSVPPTSYGSPPPPPSTSGGSSSYPYGTTTSPSPYDTPSPYESSYPTSQPQQSQYQPPTPQPQYQQPGGYQYGGAPQVPSYPQMPQAPRKNNMAIILGALAAVVVIGSVIAVLVFINSGNKPITPTTTPTATKNPNEKPLDPEASKIVFNVQTAKDIDDDYLPVDTTDTFEKGEHIYITYELDSTKFGEGTDSSGYAGYVQVKYYAGSKSYSDYTLKVEPEFAVAYFRVTYTSTTNDGRAEIYWCEKSDCSDGRLAQVAKFKVTN